MKKLNVTVNCMAVYDSYIEVPDNMNIEEAIQYAKRISLKSHLVLLNTLQIVMNWMKKTAFLKRNDVLPS